MSLRQLISDYVVDLGPESSAGKPSTGTAAPVSSGIPGIPGTSSIPAHSSAVATPSYTAIETGVNPTFVDGFTNKLREAYSKSPTADLVARFNDAMESLKEFIPEEGNRFRAAIKQVHTTPQQLIEAFQSLNAVIDGENAHFNEIMENQRKTDIGSREQSVSNITSQIEQSNNTIQQLMQQRDVVNQEITRMKTKLDTAENSFDGAAKALKTGLADTINKINIYVPSTPAATK